MGRIMKNLFYISVEVWGKTQNLFAGYEPLTGKTPTAGETIRFAENWIDIFGDTVNIRTVAVMMDGVSLAIWDGKWDFVRKAEAQIAKILEEGSHLTSDELLAELT